MTWALHKKALLWAITQFGEDLGGFLYLGMTVGIALTWAWLAALFLDRVGVTLHLWGKDDDRE